ncbi:glycosyltransferase [Parabacteroides merdae]|uniref:glycosyltransferase n=2 Tax=Parabacteroides merdae TaxID=46503 RepID=UPI001F2EF11F|nr:glycosyltransferase [Parabacteroides merdae]
MCSKALFLRKKSTGLNSIEELAYSLASRISGLKVITLPEHGNTWKGIIRNIRFAQKHQGDINHIFSPEIAYISLFLKGNVILTWHDTGTLLQSSSFLKRFIRKWFWFILPNHFAKHITCISQYTANEIKQITPRVKNKISIVYNPYNEVIHFHPKEFRKENPHILHIGTGMRKNLLRTIKALRNIPCTLIIVGIIRKTKCFDFWERNVLFPKTKRSFFRTPKHPLPCPFPLNFSLLIITKKFGNLAKNRYICIV